MPIAPITVIFGTISRRPRNRARRPETERPESAPMTRRRGGGDRLNGTWLKFSTDMADPTTGYRPKFTRGRTIPARINAR